MRKKIALGSWATPALMSLARAKRLRGTKLDPFARAEVRQTERALIVEYRDLIERLLSAVADRRVTTEHMPAAVALAELPDMVRGYEHIKMANVARYRESVAEQVAALGI
jgi:indolepyruvate ferredoxin oxidoreductase